MQPNSTRGTPLGAFNDPNRGIPLAPWNAPGSSHRDWPPENRGVPLDPFHDPQMALHSAHQEQLRIQLEKDQEIAALRAQLEYERKQTAALSKYAPVDPTIANPPTEECFVPREWTLCTLLERFEVKNPKLLLDVVYKRPALIKHATQSECASILMAATRIGLFSLWDQPAVGGPKEPPVPGLFHWIATDSNTIICASRPQFEQDARPFETIAAVLGRYRDLQYKERDGRFDKF